MPPSEVLEYGFPINMGKNEIRFMVVHVLTTAPASPNEGQIYYNSTDKRIKLWSGTAWIDMTDRAFHIGTQLASTISDFDAQVRTSRLDQMAAPTSSVSMNNQLLINLATPTGDAHAATKAYVDATARGHTDKAAARLATAAALPAHTRTGNVLTATANGALTVDGVAAALNDRVLVKDEGGGTHLENGIYFVTVVGSAGMAWELTRAADADTDAEVKSGLSIWVTEGSINDNSGWLLSTNDPITLNTTALTFIQVNGSGQILAGNGLTKTGNTLDVIGGTGITVTADLVSIDTTTVARYFTQAIGDGAATTFTITHNFGNRWVNVAVVRNSDPWEDVFIARERPTANSVIVRTTLPPAVDAWRVVITN